MVSQEELDSTAALADDPLFVLLDEDEFVPRPPRPAVAEAPLPELPDGVEPEPEDLSEAERLQEVEDLIDREIGAEILEEHRRAAFLRIAKLSALAVALALPVPLVLGWPYYSLALVDRPLHRFHAVLRPSGALGLPMGVVGTLLILASLTYVLRKTLVARLGATSLQGWMRFHIVTGILGPCFILFHSSFLPYSALGLLAFGAMTIVVASGIAGRYLLAFLPRAVDGGDIELDAMPRRLQVYRSKLVALGLDPQLLGDPGELKAGKKRPWLLPSLARVFHGDRRSREELRRLKAAVDTHGGLGEEARVVLILIRRFCRERQFFVRYYELRKIVGAWRFLHQWFAIVLIAGAAFHILVALRFGNLPGIGP